MLCGKPLWFGIDFWKSLKSESEPNLGEDVSRGCGGCKEKLDREYAYLERSHSHPVSLPKQRRNQSVEFTCLECDKGMCNDDGVVFNVAFANKLTVASLVNLIGFRKFPYHSIPCIKWNRMI